MSDSEDLDERETEGEEEEEGEENIPITKPVRTKQPNKQQPRPTKAKVKKNLPLLRLLSKADDDERCNLLQHIDAEALNVVCSCVYNAIWNCDIVPKSQRKIIRTKLGDSAKTLEYIARHKNNPVRRRRLLVRNGSSLPILLEAVLPAIESSSFGQSKTGRKTKKKKKKKEEEEEEEEANTVHD